MGFKIYPSVELLLYLVVLSQEESQVIRGGQVEEGKDIGRGSFEAQGSPGVSSGLQGLQGPYQAL